MASTDPKTATEGQWSDLVSRIKGKQPTLTAGTGINISSNTISVANPTLVNEATNATSLTIWGNPASGINTINIGKYSAPTGVNSIMLGAYSSAGEGAFAIGNGASASQYGLALLGSTTAASAYQIGRGTNSTTNTLSVGWGADSNYELLDGTTGLIPDARISTNIARTSDVPAAQVNSDWNASSGVAQILNKPTLATVATSGSYNDLSNKPTIPTVDSALSTTSTNPVQNKLITNALNSKADSSSLSSYLPLAGGTMTGNITLKDLNGARFTTNTTTYYYPDGTSVGNLPCVRDSYHDRFAFLTVGTNETTDDGTNWTAASDTSSLNNLFIQKQNQSIKILSTANKARRFVVTGTQYSQTEWFEFFVPYANSGAAQQFIFTIETSPDATTWTKRYETTFSSIMAGAYCHTGVITGGGDSYYRFTFTKTGSVTNREVYLSFLRGFTRRRGNQGLGIEQELPYNWDASKNLYSVGGLYDGNTRVVRSVTVAGSSVSSAGVATIPAASASTYGAVKVDSALSSTSTNPVQNSVIYAAIGDVESALNLINNGGNS